MSKLRPLSRKVLIRKLKSLGFEGPFVAKRHQYMLKESKKIFIANPHGKDIGVPLVSLIIKQLNITLDEFNSL